MGGQLATPSSEQRGTWNSKLGFILAAAGSAVGLGNIWRFPTETAENGGAAFLFIYLICTFVIGFPVMMAELSIGRSTQKNPVGAFKALSQSKFFPFVGMWGILCGVMILSFYTVVAGWTLSYVFVQIFHFLGFDSLATTLADAENGWVNSIFAAIFMITTILIIRGGVSDGIERATKLMMPLLLFILILMTGYTLTLDGAMDGVRVYLTPDFSKVDGSLVLSALGQAFFSLSLGMGALITYGSYLSRKENIAGAAAAVTLSDVSIAFLAGFLILPAMFVAQFQGEQIFTESGALLAGPALIFQVLPTVFDQIGGLFGLLLSVTFFLLLSIAALTSTISLLEVPVSYTIDELGWNRKSAALKVGLFILAISLIISFNISLIDHIDFVFSTMGLPIGGFLIALFVGYVWKTSSAIKELESGHEHFTSTVVGRLWPFFIKVVCPVLIFIVILQTLLA